MSGGICRCSHWSTAHFEADGSGSGCSHCPCKRYEPSPAMAIFDGVSAVVAFVCPFCSGHPSMADEVNGPLPFRVVCECGTAGPRARDRETALALWNRRYASSTLERENAELRRAMVDLIRGTRPLVRAAVLAMPSAVDGLAKAKEALGVGHDADEAFTKDVRP